MTKDEIVKENPKTKEKYNFSGSSACSCNTINPTNNFKIKQMKEIKSKLLFLILFLGISITLSAQQRNISGTVKSSSSISVPGATVAIKGTTTGTVTNIDGHYSINVPDGNTIIVFSFVGLETKEVKVGESNTIDVVLNETTIDLDEVIAIGYGTIKKSDLTGSVASVKSSDLAKMQASNLSSALAGKVAGVVVTSPSGDSPGSSPQIRIRGDNSIQGGNNPLWVIDGFISAGGANTVNPEDVESMEILKDASATAIYGSRGANGVILITTKRGKKGQSNINFKASYGIQTNSKELELMSGPEQYEYYRAFDEGHFDESIDPTMDYNWIDNITTNAPMQSYFISFNGGNEKIRYKMTADYLGQQSLVVNTKGYQRLNIRSNIDVNITDRISAGMNILLSRNIYDGTGDGSTYQDALKMSPLTPAYNSDGSYNYYFDVSDQSTATQNPIENLREKIKKNSNNTANLQTYVNIDLAESLKWSTRMSINYNTGKNQAFTPSYITNDGINRATASENQRTNYEIVNTLSFNKEFNNNHSVNAMIGQTSEWYDSYSVNSWGENYISDRYEYWNIDGGPQYAVEIDDDGILVGNPIIYNGGGSGYSEASLMSFLGRIVYNVNDKYLMTLTGRYDGASQLSEGNKWAFFPSAAVGWRISQEPFIMETGWFDNLKLRASWGKTGSQSVSNYQTLGLLSQQDRIMQDGLYAHTYLQDNLKNPSLTWEKNDQMDIGLDIGIMDNRLRFVIDYYYKKTTDMFVQKNLSAETGFGSYLDNGGSMENKGVELDIAGDIIRKKDFNWNASFNISFNKNKILDLGGVEENFTTSKNSFPALIWYNRVGYPISQGYGYVYDGIWQSEEEIENNPDLEDGASIPGDVRFLDINGDGKINFAEDRPMIIDPHPDFSFGLNNNISYKNFDLSLFFTGMVGHDLYNMARKSLFNRLKERTGFWTPGSGINDQPSAGNENVANNSYFVEKGSFIRLQNITLTYHLPKHIIKSWKLRDFNLFFSSNNLLTLTNYSGYNPEASRNGLSTSTRGIDFNSYPIVTSYYAGINIIF
jgi:TonB-linked SusC/RagA family outer membrane protein